MQKLFFLSLLFLLTTAAIGQKAEEKLVKASFEKYKSSILNDKGEEAVRYVDSRTIKYYGNVLHWVKNADAGEVEKLSMLDKLMVFTIRHKTLREDILSFNGEGLLVYAIKSGMVGKHSVANASIGSVSIEEGFAKGQYVSNGKETPLYFHFYKEENQWKIDLTSIFEVSTMAFKKMADESGQSESEYIFSLLEMMTHRKPGEEIWQPVK
jgi:hypothetical protein